MKNFKAGAHINQGSFQAFIPNGINRDWILDDMEIITLLDKANRQLGRLDMYSEYMPNIDMFISLYVAKEATQSSKIEGTQTNMEEALQDLGEVASEKRDDWEEVQNYIKAMREAISSLNNLPFSSRLIRQTHKTLLQGVRGKHKLPGEFRSSQNWIGGASISDASFVPPPFSEIGGLMSDLEKFAHREDFPDILKIALIHYQFETIHPFLDGNGRVGRLLITLYLVEKGILKRPLLYLSDFFEKNRQLYYDNLMNVRLKNDIKQWFKFFVVGVTETAKSSIATFDGIMKLQKEVELKLQTLGARASNAGKVVNQLYQNPFINAKDVSEIVEISLPSAYKLISDLEACEILFEYPKATRGKQYWFKDYMALYI